MEVKDGKYEPLGLEDIEVMTVKGVLKGVWEFNYCCGLKVSG